MKFLHLSYVIIFLCTKSSLADFYTHFSIIENFLKNKKIDVAVLYVCWAHSNKTHAMKKLNSDNISLSFRGTNDFKDHSALTNVLSLPYNSNKLGIIMEWSCFSNDYYSYQFAANALWNSSYHWLVIMNDYNDQEVASFVKMVNFGLNFDSELMLVSPSEPKTFYDVYRTAAEPRGTLIVDVLNGTSYGRWVNHLWKYDRRTNLHNLTLHAAFVVNLRSINNKSDTKEIIKHLKTYDLNQLDTIPRYSYAIFEPLLTMFNFRTTITVTNSWGEVINGRWNGLVETLLTGKTDLTAIAAMRAERLKVVDYCSVASYEFYPGFIFRHPRSGISNVFFKPFDTYVWFSCVAISLAITMTFYAIVRSENNIISSNINSLTTAVLISIGATCQQGSSEQPKKFSGRLIFVMMFLFSTILYQFYSSSIVASLLVTPVKSINTIEKLANSGLDAGVEDMANLRALIEKAAANNTMVQKIINEKIHRPGRAPEYVLPAEGVRKMQKERYAFFTDPASTYWLINSLFTEEEKCDLTEIATAREIGSQMLRKRSPYKKLFSYGNVVLLETGIIHRETQKWRAKRPKCNDGKSQTDQTAGADVSLHDVLPVLTLLFCGIVLAIVIFIIEIIVHRFKTRN